jgi:hypothetical protein
MPKSVVIADTAINFVMIMRQIALFSLMSQLA